MPQLEPANFAPQLIWLAITFIGLYLIMAKIAIPRISGTLEERADRIADDLDAAEEFNKKAEDALKSYEQALADAKAEAHEIAAQARAKIDEEISRESAALEEKLTKEAEEADKRIRDLTERALANVSDIAAEASALMIKKVSGLELEQAQVAKAIEAELAAQEKGTEA